MSFVGLSPDVLERFPHQFSGGQRQRICVARALAMEPSVLVADEAVSALDVSVQAQVLDLLKRVREEFELAMLFITHDLRVAAQVCDRIMVMKTGRRCGDRIDRGNLRQPTTRLHQGPLRGHAGENGFWALFNRRTIRLIGVRSCSLSFFRPGFTPWDRAKSFQDLRLIRKGRSGSLIGRVSQG